MVPLKISIHLLYYHRCSKVVGIIVLVGVITPYYPKEACRKFFQIQYNLSLFLLAIHFVVWHSIKMMEDFITNPALTSPSFYWSFFVNQFQTNQLFTGLLVLAIMSSLMYTLRGIPGKIFKFLKSQLTVELKIQNEDDFYDLLKFYLSQTNYVKKRCRRLTLDTNHYAETSKATPIGRCGSVGRDTVANDESDDDSANPKDLPAYTLTPMDGSHWFFYKRNIIFYTRTIDEEKGDFRKETIILRYLGRSRKLIYQLIADMQKLEEKDNDHIRIYTGSDSYWSGGGKKLKRPLDTVYIPKKDKDFLMNDMKWFLENEEWYKERGIPYHRGYLLSGPPGTGKTSIIKAICSEMDMKLGICNLSCITNDRVLMNLMNDNINNGIIIMEDIDACMDSGVSKRVTNDDTNVDAKEDQSNNKIVENSMGVTLSGLLNALDGIQTPEKQIFILTTNHPEKLDHALLRKGRIDVHMKFEYMEADMVKEMFLKFFPEEKKSANKVAKALTADGPVQPAIIQGMFFEYAKDPKAFIKSALKKAA